MPEGLIGIIAPPPEFNPLCTTTYVVLVVKVTHFGLGGIVQGVVVEGSLPSVETGKAEASPELGASCILMDV